MGPSGGRPDPSRLFWPRLLLVTVATAAVLAWVQVPSKGLYGYDSPFHIAYSRWLREHGLSRQFPWWQETFLADRFADKDFLYHVLLMPFTYGDLQAAGKIASILFGTGLYAAIFLALVGLRARAPATWTVGLLAGSTTLIYRAGLLRSHVLATALSVLGAAAILRRRRIAAGAAAALYCLCHIGWHLLPGFAILHAAVTSIRARRLRPMAVPAVLAGVAAGVLLNPYFPNNLELWWVQNARVMWAAWGTSEEDLSLGLEMRPGRPRVLAYYNAGPLLLAAAGAAALLTRRARPASADPASPAPIAGREAVPPGEATGGADTPSGEPVPVETVVTLGLATALFFGLTLASRRFVDLWAPFSVLFAATATTRTAWAWRPTRRARVAALAGGAALLAPLGAHDLGQARRILGEDRGLVYTECARWIRDHVAEGETVFTTDWDEFPDLFFVAPRQRYLVGLDPTFMYVTDAARWRLWRDVAEGRASDLYTPIRETFGSAVAFADASFERFVERADQDPLFRLEVGHYDCSVYHLRDDVRAASALGVRWRSATGAWVDAGPRDFVDVAGLAGQARREDPRAAADPPCAPLEGEIRAARAGTVALGVSTDDSIRIEIAGRTVFDSESAGPPTLEEVLSEEGLRRGRMERLLEIPLAAGANPVTVTTCRSGTVWGFHLRELPPS